jgi:hypothetical protein
MGSVQNATAVLPLDGPVKQNISHWERHFNKRFRGFSLE